MTRSPLLPPFKAVFFDMDGVVADSMKFHCVAWRAVLSRRGLVLEDIDIYKREGMEWLSSIRDIFLEKGKEPPSQVELDALMAEKVAMFERETVGLFPGMPEIIAGLKQRGILTGLVTGSYDRTVSHIIPSRVRQNLDCVITADMVKRGKPDPEPYLKALEQTGCDATEAIVVENAPMGILSAKNAGIFCIAIATTLPAGYLAQADMMVRNHSELSDYLLSN